jgi:hypothetical protein
LVEEPAILTLEVSRSSSFQLINVIVGLKFNTLHRRLMVVDHCCRSLYSTMETVEVVGIEESGRGRSCKKHECCGKTLKVDDVLTFKKINITNDEGKKELAIGAFLFKDGAVACMVGFLPRWTIAHAADYVNRPAQVTEFFQLSANKADRKKAHVNRGACRVQFLFPFDPNRVDLDSDTDSDDSLLGKCIKAGMKKKPEPVTRKNRSLLLTLVIFQSG